VLYSMLFTPNRRPTTEATSLSPFSTKTVFRGRDRRRLLPARISRSHP
jgi:hypothetical protein